MPRYHLQNCNLRSDVVVCKIGTFRSNLSTIYLEVLNIYFQKIFLEVEILMSR